MPAPAPPPDGPSVLSGGTEPETSKRTAAQTRAAIHDAARRRFNQFGFAGMTLRDIAREVGIEAQSIYNYAPSKADLVVGLMIQGTDSLAAKVDAALAQAGPGATDRLRAAVAARTEHYLDGQELVDVPIGLAHLDPERRARVVVRLKQHEDLFKQLVRDGIAGGEFRAVDVSVTSFAILGLADSVIPWYVPDGRLSIGEISRQYAELAVRMVRADDAPEGPVRTRS